MIVTCVHVSVKPEKVSEFIDAIRENHMGSVMEPGNIRFDVLQEQGDLCKFMIYEVFESAEAVAKHRETAHYLKWRDSVKDFMAGHRYAVKYNIIEPGERIKW